MKKSLVLAMAMALGVTASAYAANPFSDVPAGHWAYDSISKLAAAGVIEGYGDDTFRGDRLMTRYEMAQIVAKAMAKGANVDKLAAEFADELDALGVRVAALEKKADNVKITGNIRYRYRLGTEVNAGAGRQGTHDLRTRLFINGKINDGWTYTGLIQNVQNFRDNIGNEEDANGGNGAFHFARAFVTGRVGGIKVEAGRNDYELIGGDSDVYSDNVDAIKASYGDKFKISGWYGKPTALNEGGMPANFGKFAGIRLDYALKNVDVYAEYDTFRRGTNARVPGIFGAGNDTRDIFGIGADAQFGDFGVNALFLHGKTKNVNNGKKNGFTLQATYKGADRNKPGTWGLGVKYYHQGIHTYLIPGMDAFGQCNAPDGFKGWRVTANYTLAKNIVTNWAYYDLKGKGNGATKERTAYADVVFTF